MKTPKIDQVAFYTEDLARTREEFGRLFGMTDWIQDIAIGHGTVFDVPISHQVGELWFNYQNGFEVELLHYHTPVHWHAVRGGQRSPRLSHLGIHVQDMALARLPYEKAGWKVAQELWTDSHTNPYLRERGRTYHYVVWDSRDFVGFDLKLIQRIEQKGEQK